MTAQELRERYLKFFESKGHKRIPSASLVPENDPTVLFTTAGMHPLVPYLMGETHPEGNRLASVQKCVRTGDIEEVGDDTHLTFFEMLGNWSLQDYFKKDAIEWSYEFLTKELGLSLDKLAVSVFAGDDDAPFDEEAYKLWLEQGVPESRIAKLDKKENWWGPAGTTGPCGPDTEIFYWVGDGEAPENYQETYEDSRWVEIWNNVFMQYNKREDGSYDKLENPSVDTGMGLERTLVVLNGFKSVYETELLAPIIEAIEKVSGKKYGESDSENHSMRVIADHVRSAVMMMADGALPSNKDQGYVLRRLIRHAVREMKKLGAEGLEPIAKAALDTLKDDYKLEVDLDELKKEEDKFSKTLDKGLREVEKLYKKKGELSGDDAFILYSTFGFPLELTEEIAREHGQEVDREVFASEFRKHQDLSRAGAEQKFAGGLADHSDESKRLHTATHLMLQALRDVLGDHIEQRGSNITNERLRFDFSHDKKLTDEEKSRVEEIVNEQIKKDIPIHYEVLTLEEAKARGAIGIFEDKYSELGDKVKVYFCGDDKDGYFSKEVCGGPHVENTGELGNFKIKKEEASSAGVRRIKAILG